MNPSRDLDTLIAYRVMGYETYQNGWCDCGNDRPLAPQCGYRIDRKLGAAPHTWVVPYFSSNVGDAWAIVERLKAHEYKYTWLISDGEEAIAGCKPSVEKEGANPAVHRSDSMALSISLAACKAVGAPFEQSVKVAAEYAALEIQKP